MIYADSIDLHRQKSSYNLLQDKAFNIVKNPKHDAYHDLQSF